MFTDVHLRQVWSLLESKSVEALTLDVFDTLLWRTVPEPVHAFLLLGQRLADEGRLPAWVTPALFAQLRVHAELRARERSRQVRGTLEARLAEIWAALLPALPGAGAADELAALEVEVERDVCRADLAVAELAELSQTKLGKPVHLVSDTYFSPTHLRALLHRPELSGIRFAQVFTSSDAGVAKSEGLFDVVVRATGHLPDRIVHLGDHPVADVGGAREAGLAAVHYPKYSGGLKEVLEEEGLLAPLPSADVPLDPYAGDHGLTALRARVLHRVDAAAVPHGLRRHWETGATVFGPVLTGFGEWAVERARAYGVDHVYCLMREGQFLSQVLAGPADEAGIGVSTLWASRQVCALASVFDGSPYELRGFLHRRRPPSVGQLAAQLGVGLHEVPGLADLADARLDVPGVIDDTLAALSSEPRVRGEIVLSASRMRERLLRYLDRHLPARGTVLLVDLGWGGTIQALLQRLLRATGREVDLVGLYLATNASAQQHALDGVRTEGYVAAGGEPGRLFGPVARSPEVLEQICMPDLGSLVGFDEHLEPLLSAARLPRTQVAQKSAVQAGALAFQREWLRYRRSEAGAPSLSTAPARLQLLRTLRRFVARPTGEEALAFGVWSHDENFGSDATEGLVRDDMLRLLPYLTPYDLDKLSMQELYWPSGVASVVNKPLAVMASLAAEAGVSPEAVSPAAPAGQLEVYVDRGEDFVNGPKEVITPRSGRDGLSLARVRIQGDQVRRVRIDPAGRRGLLRVDWLRLTFHLHNVVDPRPVELTSLAASPHLHVLGARLLQGNLVEITTDDPQLVYVLDPADQADLIAATYAIDVELAFAWMGIRSEPLAVLPPPQAGAPQPLTRRAMRRLAREVAERL